MTASRPSHWANDDGTLFKNPWPTADEVSWRELYDGKLPVSWSNQDPSAEDITVVQPDWGSAALKSTAIGSSEDYLIATWLGHAGALVEIPRSPVRRSSDKTAARSDSLYLLFDPIFSYRAGPTPWTGPARFRQAPCEISDLPACDAVFISHNHFDHLDLPTVNAITKAFPDALWFVPFRNKKWMTDSGVDSNKVFEKDWWQSESLLLKDQDAKITCVPAQHNSARAGFDKNQTLWCGWVVETFTESLTRRAAVYHAGDTGYRRLANSHETCPAFKEIGDKFGGFDLSFIPIWRGGTLGLISFWGLKLDQNAIAAVHHAYPADALEIHKDVKSRNTIPVHFGTFVGSAGESQESIAEFRKACVDRKVPKLSEASAGNGRADLLNIGGSAAIALGSD